MSLIARCLLTSIVLTSTLGACTPRREVVVVREARPERPCPGGVWIAGHNGARGRWHPGHWRCEGVVERVEVE
jgi:hypothetical protein